MADGSSRRGVMQPDPEPRQPPRNYEAEQALLGALLANNEVWHRIADFMRPEFFADALHARIYEAIGRLIADGRTANAVTLKNLFDQDGALVGIGGAKYLVDLSAAVVTVISAEDYAVAIRDLYLQRQIIGVTEEIAARAYLYDPERSPADLAAEFEDRLYGLAQVAAQARATGPVPARIYLAEAMEQLQAAHRQRDVVGGIKTGLDDLDDIIGALIPGKQYILAGRPSMGKSGMAIGIGDTAARAGKKVLMFMPEMPRAEVGTRQLSMEANVSGYLGVRGRLGELDFEHLINAWRALEHLDIWVEDVTGLSIGRARAIARRHKQKHGLDLVIGDYIQLFHPDRTTDNRANDIASISRGGKEMAKELDVPVLMLSQLSRQVENREDKRPNLADLRESGSIEQDADVVMFVYREAYYLERAKPKDPAKLMDWKTRLDEIARKAEVNVAKHRGGPLGTAYVAFDGPTTKFSNLDREEPSDQPVGPPSRVLEGPPPNSYQD